MPDLLGDLRLAALPLWASFSLLYTNFDPYLRTVQRVHELLAQCLYTASQEGFVWLPEPQLLPPLALGLSPVP